MSLLSENCVMPTRKRVSAALGAIVLACLATLASARAQDGLAAIGGTGKPEKTDILFAMTQTAEQAAFVLALQEGYFKDEGLNVTWKMRGGANAVTSLVSGDSDMTTVTWLQLLLVMKQGVSLRVVAETSRSGVGLAAFVVKPASTIRGPADMIDKKLGVITKNGVCDFILNDKLREERVDYSSIRYVNVPISDMIPTLLSGGVDGVCLPEPLLSPAKDSGDVRQVVDLFTGTHDNWPVTSYAVSTAFSEKNPNTVGAFQRALRRAQKLADAQPDKVRAVVPSYTPISAELAKKMSLPTFHEIDDIPGAVKRNTDLLKRLGIM
jgi:NitT/TauT family transport system substrate-binding protein